MHSLLLVRFIFNTLASPSQSKRMKWSVFHNKDKGLAEMHPTLVGRWISNPDVRHLFKHKWKNRKIIANKYVNISWFKNSGYTFQLLDSIMKTRQLILYLIPFVVSIFKVLAHNIVDLKMKFSQLCSTLTRLAKVDFAHGIDRMSRWIRI